MQLVQAGRGCLAQHIRALKKNRRRTEEEEDGSNDKRSKSEINKQNIMLDDHNKTLTRQKTLLEQRLKDRDDDVDNLSELAGKQRDSLAQLRQLITELKAGLATKDAEIIAKDAEIARLRTEAVKTDEPDPEPPEPPPQASQPVPEPEPEPKPEPEPEPQSQSQSQSQGQSQRNQSPRLSPRQNHLNHGRLNRHR